MDRDLPLIGLLAVLFLLSVMIAAAETSFLRMPAVRARAMAAEGSKRAQRLAGLIDRLPRVLNAILLAALLSQIGAATIAGILAERWFPGALGVTLSSIGLTVVLFIYSEAIPKTYAVRHADRVALALAVPIAGLELVLRPVVSVLVWIADVQMPGKGVVMAPTITEDELRMLASTAATEGQITGEDATLIERAFRVGDRQADDVMVPRTDIVSVERSSSAADALEIALGAGHRRLPVYDQTRENITGMVRLRDLIRVPAERRRDVEVGSLAESLLVVPESKRVMDLLQEMQGTGTHMAVVVDEYGGTAGLVTVEDIVEEMLGSITEGPMSEEVVQIEPGCWLVDGALPVEDLEEILGTEVDHGDWNTAAGLVLGLLGHVPRVGDLVEVADHDLRVTAVRGRRITRLEIRERRRDGGDTEPDGAG
jgi:putative hemolysin